MNGQLSRNFLNQIDYYSIIFPDKKDIVSFYSINSTFILRSLSIETQGSLIIKSYNESNLVLSNILVFINSLLSKPIISTDSLVNLNSLSLICNICENSIISSLIETEKEVSITISDIHLSNFVSEGVGTLLLTGRVYSLNIVNSQFSNITKNNYNHKDSTNNSASKASAFSTCYFSKMQGCKTFYTESPFYGYITTPVGNLHSLTHNSSFIERFTTTVTSAASYESGDNTFTDSFFQCSREGRGGALYFNGSAHAKFTNCTFYKCSNTDDKENSDTNARGGAIWFNSSGYFKCQTTNCTECNAKEGDSFFSLWKGNVLLLSQCLFSNASSERYGGVNIEDGPYWSVVRGCTFEHGSTSRFGGGAGLMLSFLKDKFLLTECAFQHNRAVEFAGALFFFFQNANVLFTCRYLKFNNNTVSDKSSDNTNNYPFGADICLTSNFDGKYTSATFYMCVSDGGTKRFSRCNYTNDECSFLSSYDYLLNYPANELFVDNNTGTDSFECGLQSGTRCQTLSYALTRWHPLIQNEINIIVLDQTKDKQLDIDFKNVIISASSSLSRDAVRPIVSLEAPNIAGSALSISDGNLKMNNLSIILINPYGPSVASDLCRISNENASLTLTYCSVSGGTTLTSDDNALCSSLLKLTDGKITLNSVSFANFLLENGPLLNIVVGLTESNFITESVSFTNIKRKDGNGTIFEMVVGNGESLRLNNFSFNECESLNGNGGAIYLQVSGDYELKFSSITFSNCKSSNGNSYYVLCDDFTKISEKLKGNILNESTYLKDAIGYDGNLVIPLVVIIRTPPNPTYVNNESTGVPSYCGFEDYPCAELNDGFNRNSLNIKNIIVVNEISESKSLSLDSAEYVISKKDDNSVIKASSYCCFAVSKNTKIDGIKFTIENQLNGNLITVSGETLTLNNAIFESNNGITCTESIIKINSGGSMTMNGGSMLGFSGNVYDGSGINALLTTQTFLSISKVSFENCVASNCGGAIYLKISDSSENFNIPSVTFNGNSASFGNNLCLIMQNLCSKKIINYLPYLKFNRATLQDDVGFEDESYINQEHVYYLSLFALTATKNIYLNVNGEDSKLCGFVEYPCKSLDYTLLNYAYSSSFAWGGASDINIILESDIDSTKVISLNKPNTKISGDIISSFNGLKRFYNSLSNEDHLKKLIINDASGSDGLIMCVAHSEMDSLQLVFPKTTSSSLHTVFLIEDTSVNTLPTLDNTRTLVLNNDILSSSVVDGTIELIWFTVKQGLLEFNSVKFENINLDSYPFLDISTTLSLVDLHDCNFNNICSKFSEILKIHASSVYFERNTLKKICFTGGTTYDNVSFINTLESIDLHIIDCEVSDITTNSKCGSLINAIVDKSNTLNISNTSINICKSESSNVVGGGCIYITLIEDGIFRVSSSKLYSCCVSDTIGRGGGIYLFLDGTSKNDYHFTDLTFDNNVAFKGRDIYINANNINLAALQEKFDFSLPSDLNARENSLWGCNTSSPNDEIDITSLWKYRSSNSYCSDSGIDENLCGSLSMPCNTLDKAYEQLFGEPQYLYVKESSSMGRSFEITGITLSSYHHNEYGLMKVTNRDKEKSSLRFSSSNEESKESSSMLFNNGDASVQRVAFYFTRFTDCSYLIESNGNIIRIGSCAFSTDEEEPSDFVIQSSFVHISSGLATFTNITCDNIRLSKDAFIFDTEFSSISVFQITQNKSSFQSGGLISIKTNHSLKQNITLEKIFAEEVNVVDSSLITILLDKIDGSENEFICSLNSLNLSKISCSSTIPAAMVVRPASEELDVDRSKNIFNITLSSFVNCTSSKDTVAGIGCRYEKVTIKSQFVTFDGGLDTQESSYSSSSSSFSYLGKSNDDAPEGLCSWTESYLDLVDVDLEASHFEVINCPMGGMHISKGSNVILDYVQFENNTGNIEKYQNARRNALCSSEDASSSISITSVKGGDGYLPNTSLWIIPGNCQIGGLASAYPSPFFVPVLTTVYIPSLTEGVSGNDVTITGMDLLPCNLSLSIRVYNPKTEEEFFVPITITEYVNETQVKGNVNVSSFSKYKKTCDISVSFSQGENSKNSSIFYLYGSNSTEYKSEKGSGSNKYLWALILFIICLIILIILVIIIFFLYKRMKKYKPFYDQANSEEEEDKQKEMEESNENDKFKSEDNENKLKLNLSEIGEEGDSGISGAVEGIGAAIGGALLSGFLLNSKDKNKKNKEVSSSSSSTPAVVGLDSGWVECCEPFEEIEKVKGRTMKDWMEEKLKRKNCSVLDKTTSDVTLAKEEEEEEGDGYLIVSIGIMLSVMKCLNNLKEKKDSRVWKVGSVLSPKSIFLSNSFSEDEWKNGKGVYLSFASPSEGTLQNALRYASPEMRSAGEKYMEEIKSDENKERSITFTVGLILLECVTDKEPFFEETEENAHSYIEMGQLPEVEEDREDKLMSVIKDFLEFTSERRPKMKEAVENLQTLFIKDDEKENNSNKENSKKDSNLDVVDCEY